MKITFALLALLLAFAGAASAQECEQPLDEKTLNQLRLGWDDIQLHPGDSHQFSLAILSTFAPSKQVAACATWKVEPADKGATISATGLLKLDAKTPPQTRFVVTADIEHGRAQRQIEVLVYTDEDQPLVGFWREQSRFDCDTQKETPSAQPIQEFELRAKGWFAVTWIPFEVYRDYWGSYTADKAPGTLSLQIEDGNYVPQNFRGQGKYKMKDRNTLEVSGIYLGEKRNSNQSSPAKVGEKCRYIFTRMQ